MKLFTESEANRMFLSIVTALRTYRICWHISYRAFIGRELKKEKCSVELIALSSQTIHTIRILCCYLCLKYNSLIFRKAINKLKNLAQRVSPLFIFNK